MKNLILIVFVFFALNSFAQTPPNTSLYAQGFRVGADLAKECTELSRRLYLATTGGNFPLEYLAGVNEGWAANISACYGDAINPPGPQPSRSWLCLMFGGSFCTPINPADWANE